MKAKRSTLEMKYFVKERKDPLLTMTWVMSQWWWTRRTWTSEFQDYHIPLWSMRKDPASENWFRKSRTIQVDMLLNKIYDKINHFILSVQNQKQMIQEVGIIELCELLETEPKTQCKTCLSYWHIGIVYCTSGHFLRKDTGQSEIRQIYNGPSLCRWVCHQKDLMDIDMGKSQETKIYG